MTDTKTPKEPEVIAIQASKPGRKRRFTPEEKQRLLQEAAAPGETISSVARRYGVSPSLMFRWRNLEEHGSLESLGADEQVVPVSEVKNLKAKVRELERLSASIAQLVDCQLSVCVPTAFQRAPLWAG